MASENETRNLFISHHHADDEHIDKLKNILANRDFNFRNSSIRAKPKNQERLDRNQVSDETIRRLLRRKISWAGVVVVLIGKETHQRPWVDWEIAEAKKQGKRIVGIYIRGGTEADKPANLENYGSAIVAWDSNSIIAAIEGTENTFENPDGTQRPPVNAKTSVVC